MAQPPQSAPQQENLADALLLDAAPTYDTVIFPDGSVYKGTLRGGQPDGLGTCTWADGNVYDGEWRAGAMHGFGTLTWASGERYDGEWRDGRRDGIGVKCYSDGSTFEGFWREGLKHGVGVFRPARAARRGITVPSSPTRSVAAPGTPTAPATGDAHDSGSGNRFLATARSAKPTKPSTPMGGSQSNAAGAVAGLPSGFGPTTHRRRSGSSSGGGAPPQSSAPLTVPASRHGSETPPILDMLPLPSGPDTVTPTEPAAAQGAAALLGQGLRPLGVPRTRAGSAPGFLPPATPSTPPQPGPSHAHHVQFGGAHHLRQAPSMQDAGAAWLRTDSEPAQPEGSFVNGLSELERGSLRNVMPGDELPGTPSGGAAVGGAAPFSPAPDRSVAANEATVAAGQPPDARDVVFIRRFEDGKLTREDRLTKADMRAIFKGVWQTPRLEEPRAKRVKRQVQRAFGRGKKLQQKAGQLIYKGMPGYDLMLRLQLGIRQSVGHMAKPTVRRSQPGGAEAAAATAAAAVSGDGSVRAAANASAQPSLSAPKPRLQPRDFTAKTKVFFPSSGSSLTPAHPSSDFKWKDYAPKVFSALRSLWGLPEAEYMLSLAGSHALRQLSSPGKSGCMFFLSDDQRFIVKTMRKSEIHTFIHMLPQYYTHMEANPDSLIPRFYGVYGVKQLHGRTVRFVVMGNIFATDLQLHRRFDLKGSTFERSAGPMDPLDTKTVWKDLDLDMAVQLPKELHERLHQQLASDVAFLEAVGVMDYSLLLGVHFCARGRAKGPDAAVPPTPGPGMMSPAPKLADPPVSAANVAPSAAGWRPADVGQLPTNAAAQKGDAPAPAAPVEVAVAAAATAAAAVDSGWSAVPHSGANGGDGLIPDPRSLPPVLASPFASSTMPADLVSDAQLLRGYLGGSGTAPDTPLAGDPGNGRPTPEPSIANPLAVQHTYLPLQQSPGGFTLPYADRLPVNFDVFSSKEARDQTLQVVEARMRARNFSEQRIQDVMALARLKILGEKLKHRRRGRYMHTRASGVVRARDTSPQRLTGGDGTDGGAGPGGGSSGGAGGTAAPPSPAPGPSAVAAQPAPAATRQPVSNNTNHTGGLAGDSAGDTEGDAAKDSDSSADEAIGASGYRAPHGTLQHDATLTRTLYPSPTLAFQPLPLGRMPLGHNIPARVVYHPSLAAASAHSSDSTAATPRPRPPTAHRSGARFSWGMQCLGAGQVDDRIGATNGGGDFLTTKPPQPAATGKQAGVPPSDQQTPGPAGAQTPSGGDTELVALPAGHQGARGAASPHVTASGVVASDGDVKGGAAAGQGGRVTPIDTSAAGAAPADGGEEVWLCFGIIDILQDWSTRKVVERGFKAALHDGNAISVAPPGLYAHRFMEFMKAKVFPAPMPATLVSMGAWQTPALLPAGPSTMLGGLGLMIPAGRDSQRWGPALDGWWTNPDMGQPNSQLLQGPIGSKPGQQTILEADDGEEADSEAELTAV